MINSSVGSFGADTWAWRGEREPTVVGYIRHATGEDRAAESEQADQHEATNHTGSLESSPSRANRAALLYDGREMTTEDHLHPNETQRIEAFSDGTPPFALSEVEGSSIALLP